MMSTHSAEAGEDYYTEKSAAGRLFARGCSHGNITSSLSVLVQKQCHLPSRLHLCFRVSFYAKLRFVSQT
ncbi:hypothetical protein WJX82_004531 [Trebouxia sp. C0006]